MPTATALAFPEEDLVGWERTLVAFLVEKQRRSGSLRTFHRLQLPTETPEEAAPWAVWPWSKRLKPPSQTQSAL